MLNISVFSKRLKSERMNQGLSQKGLAEKAGIASATLSSYEGMDNTKKKYPTIDKAVALAEALNVSLDWLCGLQESATERTEKERVIPLSDYLKKMVEVFLLSDSILFTEETPPFEEMVFPGETNTIANIRFSNYQITTFLSSFEKINALRVDGTITAEMTNEWVSGGLKKYSNWAVNTETGEILDLTRVISNSSRGIIEDDELPF